MGKKDIVQITWLDPHSVDAWVDLDDKLLNSEMIINTVGILLRENKKCYVVTLNYDFDNDQASCSMIIPKACVIKFKKTGHISGRRK